jgi:hypothetical protein
MKPLLYIVTPVSRPENLGRVALSFRNLVNFFEVRWLPIFDNLGPDLGGGRKRNTALNQIVEPGWIYFLDDDNQIHPLFPSLLSSAISHHPTARMFVFHQANADGSPRIGFCVDEVRCGTFDTARFLVHSEAVGEARWPENDYFTDSHFAAHLVNVLHIQPVFLPEIACYYNALS